jgi:hypothetical protein
MADDEWQLELVLQEFSEDGVFTLSHYKKRARDWVIRPNRAPWWASWPKWPRTAHAN